MLLAVHALRKSLVSEEVEEARVNDGCEYQGILGRPRRRQGAQGLESSTLAGLRGSTAHSRPPNESRGKR